MGHSTHFFTSSSLRMPLCATSAAKSFCSLSTLQDDDFSTYTHLSYNRIHHNNIQSGNSKEKARTLHTRQTRNRRHKAGYGRSNQGDTVLLNPNRYRITSILATVADHRRIQIERLNSGKNSRMCVYGGQEQRQLEEGKDYCRRRELRQIPYLPTHYSIPLVIYERMSIMADRGILLYFSCLFTNKRCGEVDTVWCVQVKQASTVGEVRQGQEGQQSLSMICYLYCPRSLDQK